MIQFSATPKPLGLHADYYNFEEESPRIDFDAILQQHRMLKDE